MPSMDDHLASIDADLPVLVDHLQWCATVGWAVERADRDRPRRLPDDDVPDPRSDQVPGARDDIGIGVHAARTAVEQVGPWLQQAEVILTAAAVHVRPDRPVEPLLGAGRHGPVELVVACNRMARAATDVRAGDGHDRRVVRAVAKARDLIYRSARRVERPFTDLGDVANVIGTPLCWVCEVRPRAESKRGQATEGGRCSTCARYRRRSRDGRQERPRSLDGHDVPLARMAKAKRAARGEGWGDESLSTTQDPPILPEPPALTVEGLTLRDAAARLGLPREEVRALVVAGHLDAQVVRGRHVITEEAINQYRRKRP